MKSLLFLAAVLTLGHLGRATFCTQGKFYSADSCGDNEFLFDGSSSEVNNCYNIDFNGNEFSQSVVASASFCNESTTVTISEFTGHGCQGAPTKVVFSAKIGECAFYSSTAFGLNLDMVMTCSSCPEDTCFPADGVVELESGGTKTMAELAVGDRVRTGSGFSDVFLFTTEIEETISAFVDLTTEAGSTLSTTAQHYVIADGKLVQSQHVKIGSKLQMANGTETAVVAISASKRRGLYNPQTLDGSIVVNGLRASTYTGSVEPGLAHSLLWPLRMLYSAGVTGFDGLASEPLLKKAALAVLPRGQ